MGSAARSTLPFGVSGKASSRTNAEGTRCSGSAWARSSRRAAAVQPGSAGTA
ncbi:hypothetical protein ACFQV2_22035 [Actinokineospora soli]|uniref:Uncharacterized protein n=1 Tax=Actinokineospora soli TaxID=1048753 RepID=A0ABW2TPP5_9PSEU